MVYSRKPVGSEPVPGTKFYKKRDRPFFNDKARLDTSQVQDRRPGTRYDNSTKRAAGSYNNFSKNKWAQREAPTSYNRNPTKVDPNNRALSDQALRRSVIKSRMRKAV